MLVSVIIPAYNAGQYIGRAIASVQAQTHTEWELIISDDSSSDNTCEIAERLAKEDPRIRLVKSKINRGAAAARNAGVSAGKGEYIAFLDADDTWQPDKLEVQLQRLRKSGAALCYTSYAIVNSAGEKIRADYIVPEKTDYEALLRENVIGCSTVLISAELAKAHPFEKGFYHEDYVLWLRLLKQEIRVIGCPEVLANWCWRENSRSYDKWNSMKKRWRIYRKAMGLPFGKSAGYLFCYAVAGLRKYTLSRSARSKGT